MTAVAKTYTFVPGTPIESDHANQNFDDLVNYTNGEVIVRDASKAFTAIPSGPGTDPTSPNQFTRKQYVDNLNTAVTASVTNLTTTVTNNKTAQDAADALRPTVSGISNPIIKAADAVVTTDVFGHATVTFPTAFATALDTLVVTSGDAGVPTQFMSIHARSNSNFTVRCFTSAVVGDGFGGFTLQRAISQSVRVSYIAVGR
jgi:hypothetical protein